MDSEPCDYLPATCYWSVQTCSLRAVRIAERRSDGLPLLPSDLGKTVAVAIRVERLSRVFVKRLL